MPYISINYTPELKRYTAGKKPHGPASFTALFAEKPARFDRSNANQETLFHYSIISVVMLKSKGRSAHCVVRTQSQPVALASSLSSLVAPEARYRRIARSALPAHRPKRGTSFARKL